METDYVALYVNSVFGKEDDPQGFFALIFLFLGRMLPIITLAPFFGARVLPHPVKMTFAFSLFAIFMPQLITSLKEPLGWNHLLAMYMLKEIFIGVLMGFIIGIPFQIVSNAGMIIDHQRGGASLMVNDPIIQNQSSPLGTFFNFVLIYVFFLIDGPFIVINALSLSYDIIPVDRFLSESFFDQNSNFFTEITHLFNKVMVLSTQLAAPALIAILMTDMFLGIANRLAPQVQITFLGMPLKSLLGLAVICFGWKLFVNQLVTESYRWLNELQNMMTFFKPS